MLESEVDNSEGTKKMLVFKKCEFKIKYELIEKSGIPTAKDYISCLQVGGCSGINRDCEYSRKLNGIVE